MKNKNKALEMKVNRVEKKLAKILTAEIAKQGKSYNFISKEVDISPHTVKRVASMEYSPVLSNLIKVADNLGLEIALKKK